MLITSFSFFFIPSFLLKLLVSLYLTWPICPVSICYTPLFPGMRDLMIPTGSIKVWSYFNFSFEISGWNSILNFIWFSGAALQTICPLSTWHTHTDVRRHRAAPTQGGEKVVAFPGIFTGVLYGPWKIQRCYSSNRNVQKHTVINATRHETPTSRHMMWHMDSNRDL